MLRVEGRRALLFLLLYALVATQAVAAFGPEHLLRHAGHCCPACHVSNAVELSSMDGPLVPHPDDVRGRQVCPEPSFFVPEPLVTTGGSRAPPA